MFLGGGTVRICEGIVRGVSNEKNSFDYFRGGLCAEAVGPRRAGTEIGGREAGPVSELGGPAGVGSNSVAVKTNVPGDPRGGCWAHDHVFQQTRAVERTGTGKFHVLVLLGGSAGDPVGGEKKPGGGIFGKWGPLSALKITNEEGGQLAGGRPWKSEGAGKIKMLRQECKAVRQKNLWIIFHQEVAGGPGPVVCVVC